MSKEILLSKSETSDEIHPKRHIISDSNWRIVSPYLSKVDPKAYKLLKDFYWECYGPEGDTEIFNNDLPKLIEEINNFLESEKNIDVIVFDELNRLKSIAEIGISENLNLYGVAD